MGSYYGDHPGRVEVSCDEHGTSLVSQRRPDGMGGGWAVIECPYCRAEREAEKHANKEHK
jgi:hypothetical protein